MEVLLAAALNHRNQAEAEVEVEVEAEAVAEVVAETIPVQGKV